jgi:hypothetical protein
MATKKTIDVELLWQIERLGAPQPRPRRRAGRGRQHPLLDGGQQVGSSLWLLSTLGGTPRR